MTAWHFGIERSLRSVPRPADASRAHGDGVDPDRVLILGNGPAYGWGVLSHELALPGQLARELARATGRGIDVDLVTSPSIRSTTHMITEIRAWRYDAIIVTFGVNEAIRLEPPKRWRASVEMLIHTLLGESAATTRIVIVGMQPIRSIPVYDSPLGSVADAHARTLNRITDELCGMFDKVSYLPLSAPARAGGKERHRTAEQYHDWAKVLSEHVAPKL
ncbi:MAG: SGNH/GDSL hydrolase family protein [Lacisediminihabitans sp.]